MAVVSMNFLLEAGVHFGHQTKRWNPKMKEYIFGAREDIYIIDLEKTNTLLEQAYNELKTITSNGGKALFVGTKKQASEVCVEEAIRSKSYYVTERWLGGMLTKDGTFDKLPKKEVIGLKKEYDKLNRVLCGIRDMIKLPQALIIVDPKKEFNAIKEAKKLNIPVFGLIDTNADPDVLDFVIPGNDDAVKSIKLIFGVLNNAICEATGLEMIDFLNEEDKKTVVKKEDKDEPVAEIFAEKEIEAVKEEPEITVKATVEIVEEIKKVVEPTEEKKEKIDKPIKEESKVEVEKKPRNSKKVLETKEEKIDKPIKKESKVEVEKKPRSSKKVSDVKEEKVDLNKLSLTELKSLAKESGIKGYSTMKKNELIEILNK